MHGPTGKCFIDGSVRSVVPDRMIVLYGYVCRNINKDDDRRAIVDHRLTCTSLVLSACGHHKPLNAACV